MPGLNKVQTLPAHSGCFQLLLLRAVFAANFTFFQHRDHRHQDDTADGCRIQRRKVPAQPVRPKIGVPSAIIPRPSLAKLSPIR
jgi:hypothetical protein